MKDNWAVTLWNETVEDGETTKQGVCYCWLWTVVYVYITVFDFKIVVRYISVIIHQDSRWEVMHWRFGQRNPLESCKDASQKTNFLLHLRVIEGVIGVWCAYHTKHTMWTKHISQVYRLETVKRSLRNCVTDAQASIEIHIVMDDSGFTCKAWMSVRICLRRLKKGNAYV